MPLVLVWTNPNPPFDESGSPLRWQEQTEPTETEVFEDWEKRENGDISVAPLVGFSTAIFAQSAIAVKLDFPREGDRPDEISGRTQLAMTPYQAIEFARALQNAAEKILAIKPDGRPS